MSEVPYVWNSIFSGTSSPYVGLFIDNFLTLECPTDDSKSAQSYFPGKRCLFSLNFSIAPSLHRSPATPTFHSSTTPSLQSSPARAVFRFAQHSIIQMFQSFNHSNVSVTPSLHSKLCVKVPLNILLGRFYKFFVHYFDIRNLLVAR